MYFKGFKGKVKSDALILREADAYVYVDAMVTAWPRARRRVYEGNPYAWEDGVIRVLDTQRANHDAMPYLQGLGYGGL